MFMYTVLYRSFCQFLRFLQRAQCSHCKRCISYSNSVCPSVCGTGFQRTANSVKQCHSTNTVKALKETNSTDPNHRKSCSRLILSSSITTLLTEGAHTQPFYGAFPELPGWASARRNLLLDFYGVREDNRGRHTNHPAGCTPSGLISNPPPTSPIFYTGRPPATTFPLYLSLGQTQNMLDCIPTTQWHGYWQKGQCSLYACSPTPVQ